MEMGGPRGREELGGADVGGAGWAWGLDGWSRTLVGEGFVGEGGPDCEWDGSGGWRLGGGARSLLVRRSRRAWDENDVVCKEDSVLDRPDGMNALKVARSR